MLFFRTTDNGNVIVEHKLIDGKINRIFPHTVYRNLLDISTVFIMAGRVCIQKKIPFGYISSSSIIENSVNDYANNSVPTPSDVCSNSLLDFL